MTRAASVAPDTFEANPHPAHLTAFKPPLYPEFLEIVSLFQVLRTTVIGYLSILNQNCMKSIN